MKEKVCFFLPTRKGSIRVANKNTKPFASFKGGLLELKLSQLVKSTVIDEIILSTNDPECISIGETFLNAGVSLRIIQRPEYLCLDTTNLQDLIRYVPTITNAEHIIWGHVTTPIANEKDYDQGLNNYFIKLKEGFDSLVSVIEFRNFLLDDSGNLINNSTDIPWPRTQDLSMLYEMNHVMFITQRNVYQKDENRLGNKPYLFVMNKIRSVDVDWEDDFKIAEILYEKTYKP